MKKVGESLLTVMQAFTIGAVFNIFGGLLGCSDDACWVVFMLVGCISLARTGLKNDIEELKKLIEMH